MRKRFPASHQTRLEHLTISSVRDAPPASRLSTLRILALLVLMPMAQAVLALPVTNIYWADVETNKIQRSDADGTGVEDVVTGLSFFGPYGVFYEGGSSKIYWSHPADGKIQRANRDGTGIEDVRSSSSPFGLAVDQAQGKVYWSDNVVPGKIYRGNIDGTGSNEIVVTGLSNPSSEIALDLVNGHVYWIDGAGSTGVIERSNLDGTNVVTLVTTTPSTGLAVDLALGKIYWTASRASGDPPGQKIQRANLDGTGVETLISGLDSLGGIALGDGKMYWTSYDFFLNSAGALEFDGKIQRANLDGTALEDLVTGLEMPWGISLEFASVPEPSTVLLLGFGIAGFGLARRRKLS